MGQYQINCPYFKKRYPQISKMDKLMLKIEYVWYIKNWRSFFMKLCSFICILLSLAVLAVQLQFFFEDFENR